MITNFETHATIEIEVYKHGGSYGRKQAYEFGESKNLAAIDKGFNDLMAEPFVIEFLRERNIHVERDAELAHEHWSDVEDFEDYNAIVAKESKRRNS